MYEQNAKKPLLFFILSIFLLLMQNTAQAKITTFASGVPLGFGLKGGLSQKPTSDVLSATQTSSSVGYFYAFEPFLDLEKVILRGSFSYNKHPLMKGSGSDSVGAYAETSDAYSYSYAFHLLLAPFINKKLNTRGYFLFGYGSGKTFIKSERTYTATSTSYLEKALGKKQEVLLGAGFEFIFIQNYSLQLEAGYRFLRFDRLTHESASDLAGNPKTPGEVLMDASGTQKKFDLTGYFASVGFNINF